MFSTVLGQTAAAAADPYSWVRVLTVATVFAVVWPVAARLRRTLSERRRARWTSGARGASGATEELADSGRHDSAPGSPD